MLLATDIAALDHHEGTVTLIANAINWDASDERVDNAYDDAVARLDRMTAELAAPAPSTVGRLPTRPSRGSPAAARREQTTPPSRSPRSTSARATRSRSCCPSGSRSPPPADPLDVYRVLRATNPSPYMYLLRLDGRRERFDIVGS